MIVLSVDQANVSGFAIGKSTPEGLEILESGTWNVTIKSQESAGVRLMKFKSALAHYISKYKVDVAVFERPAGRFKNSIILSSQLIGVGQVYLEENGIEFSMVSAKEAKKAISDNGNAGKQLVMDSVNKKFGLKITDDNESDAIAILYTFHMKINSHQ